MEVVKMGRGRPKHSVLTPQGMVERFLKKYMSAAKLARLYEKLTPTEQLKMLSELAPYCMAKKQAETLSAEDINKLYQKLEDAARKAV